MSGKLSLPSPWQTGLAAHDLGGFEAHWSGVLQHVPKLGLSDDFLMVNWGDPLWGRLSQGWSALLTTSPQWFVLLTPLITDELDLPASVKVLLARLLHCEAAFLFPFHILRRESKAASRASTPGRGVKLHLLEEGA